MLGGVGAVEASFISSTIRCWKSASAWILPGQFDSRLCPYLSTIGNMDSSSGDACPVPTVSQRMGRSVPMDTGCAEMAAPRIPSLIVSSLVADRMWLLRLLVEVDVAPPGTPHIPGNRELKQSPLRHGKLKRKPFTLSQLCWRTRGTVITSSSPGSNTAAVSLPVAPQTVANTMVRRPPLLVMFTCRAAMSTRSHVWLNLACTIACSEE